MIYVSEFKIKVAKKNYPFIPLILNTPNFEFTKPVTVLCGGNGSGKTTFAKLLAEVSDCVYVAYGKSGDIEFKRASDSFYVVKKAIPKRKFYFSAEDFVQFIRETEEKKRDALAAIEEINADTLMSGYAKQLAKQPHVDTLIGFENFYGVDLSEVSHGQSFLAFFDKRLNKDGFYVIDEPEAALSYENQYLLAYKIYQAAQKKNCQFVICTHSPVIAAVPDADIFQINDEKFVKMKWEDTENASFLNMFFRKKDVLFED